MMFQVTHTHTNATCPAQSPEQTKRITDWWQAMKNTPGVKVLAGYVSPMDHTFHITVDADDYPTLARALGPLNTIGQGHTSPVLALDQAFAMAATGAFR
ncbi:MAG: hypothetical protein HYU30_04790 [Chloroflexi bacterium]|nr:hypothetical protein [Chloroflexota bacterium]MBI4197974.1 hypothetical protein [Chloroflexota bacterium]